MMTGSCPHCGVAVDLRPPACSQCGQSLLMDLRVDVHDDDSREVAAEVLAEACGGDKPRFRSALKQEGAVPLRAAPILEAERAHEALTKRGIQARLTPVSPSLRPAVAQTPGSGLARISRGKAVGITVGVIALLFAVRFLLFADEPAPAPLAQAAAELPELDAQERAAAAARKAHEAEMEQLRTALGVGGLLSAAELRTVVEEVPDKRKKRKRRRKKRKPRTRKVRTMRASVLMTGNDAGTREQTFRVGSCKWTRTPVQAIPLGPDTWRGQATPLADLGRIVPVQQVIYELPVGGCEAAKSGARLRLDGAPKEYAGVSLK